MGRLTTHVLDTAVGMPAAGVHIDLYSVKGDARQKLCSVQTNNDGRCDSPLLEGEAYQTGEYELVFHVGDYLDKQGTAHGTNGDGPRFLNIVPIRFGIDASNDHYHVPLLISPFGYSTYRGS